MKFHSLHIRIKKIIKKKYETPEKRNHEILRIPCRNPENHKNLIILLYN